MDALVTRPGLTPAKLIGSITTMVAAIRHKPLEARVFRVLEKGRATASVCKFMDAPVTTGFDGTLTCAISSAYAAPAAARSIERSFTLLLSIPVATLAVKAEILIPESLPGLAICLTVHNVIHAVNMLVHAEHQSLFTYSSTPVAANRHKVCELWVSRVMK
jgi:hypothetical protein